MAGPDRQRHQERALVETSDRSSREKGESPFVRQQLQPGTHRQRLDPCAEIEEAHLRRGRGVDEKPPCGWEGARRRAGRSPEGGQACRRRKSRRVGRGRPLEREKEKGQERESKGERERSRGTERGVAQPRHPEAAPQQGLGSHPGGKRSRPGPPEKEEISQKSREAYQEAEKKEKDKQRFFLDLEKTELQQQRGLQFQRGLRHLWADQDGKEDCRALPRSFDSQQPGDGTGATSHYARTGLGVRSPRTTSSVPSIFSSSLGAPDESGNEEGSAPSLLLPGFGAPGTYPRADGCHGTTAQSPRRADCRAPLVGHLSVRGSPGGAGVGGDSLGNRGSNEGSPGSRKAAGPERQSIWVDGRPGSHRGVEERGWQREDIEGPRKRQGLEAGLKRGQQGLQKRNREGKGERERKMIGKVASPGQKGEKASPAGIYVVEAATIISPGQGEEKKMSVAAAASDSSKPPSFTTGTLPVEGKKPEPSWADAPTGAASSTTNVFEREVGSLQGEKFVAMGNLLDIALDDLHNLVISHSKPQSTGKGKVDIFPLPLSSPVIEGSRCPSMARATCRALNSLYGVPLEREKVPVSAGCERAIRFICSCVDAMALWTEVFPPMDFEVFFRSKGVDYRGEEVRVAQKFSWKTISPALPPEVGSVSLIDFCSLGTKYYVEHFPEFLVPPEKRFLGRAPTVMVDKEDWLDVCSGLIQSGICGVIPIEQVCHIQGRPLLGGCSE